MNVIARWPNGDIQEAEWLCSCDNPPKRKGWYLDGGKLDLGLVRDEQLQDDSDNFWIYDWSLG